MKNYGLSVIRYGRHFGGVSGVDLPSENQGVFGQSPQPAPTPPSAPQSPMAQALAQIGAQVSSQGAPSSGPALQGVPALATVSMRAELKSPALIFVNDEFGGTQIPVSFYDKTADGRWMPNIDYHLMPANSIFADFQKLNARYPVRYVRGGNDQMIWSWTGGKSTRDGYIPNPEPVEVAAPAVYQAVAYEATPAAVPAPVAPPPLFSPPAPLVKKDTGSLLPWLIPLLLFL